MSKKYKKLRIYYHYNIYAMDTLLKVVQIIVLVDDTNIDSDKQYNICIDLLPHEKIEILMQLLRLYDRLGTKHLCNSFGWPKLFSMCSEVTVWLNGLSITDRLKLDGYNLSVFEGYTLPPEEKCIIIGRYFVTI